MKRPIVKSVWLDVSGADYFEDEVTSYVEGCGYFYLDGEDTEGHGHPFCLTVSPDSAWVDFFGETFGLAEEKAERAILSLLREEVKDMRGAIEDRNTY